MACGAVGVIILSGLVGSLTAVSRGKCDLYSAVGQSLTIPFATEGLRADVLRWTHNGTIIFSREQGRVSVGKPEDILSVGSLKLKDIKHSSAGIYDGQVLDRNASLTSTWHGRLCVVDRVPKPQLTFTCDFKTNAVHLKCQVASPEGLSFSWTLDEKPLTGETKPGLSVSLAQLKGDRSFTCSVADRFSTDKSDAARPKCKAPPPPPPPPAPLCFKKTTIVAVLAGNAALILILFSVIVALCCCRRRRHDQPGSDPGETGRVRMLSLKRQEAESCGPEYETMQPPEDSPPPIPEVSCRACYENVSRPEGQPENTPRPSQLAAAADEKKPSPVPKPRTKAPNV